MTRTQRGAVLAAIVAVIGGISLLFTKARGMPRTFSAGMDSV